MSDPTPTSFATRRTRYSADGIKVVRKNGWPTLEGTADWNYVRERAESAVKRIRGVKGVTNSITLKPKVAPYEIRRKIEDAFRRSAELDASRISVEANGSEVILRGTANPSNNPDVYVGELDGSNRDRYRGGLWNDRISRRVGAR